MSSTPQRPAGCKHLPRSGSSAARCSAIAATTRSSCTTTVPSLTMPLGDSGARSGSRERTLASFIERYGFATLISGSAGELVASHIPIMLLRSGERLSLIGHVARANAQWKQFDGGADALAIFHGPHSYVSPTWYATSPAVPTWNYAAVQRVRGKPRCKGQNRDFTLGRCAERPRGAVRRTPRVKPWRMEDLAG